MSSLLLSAIAFAFIVAGAGIGMLLRRRLPGHHLNDDTKDVVGQGASLIRTMTALVLGLLVVSAKGTFDTEVNQVKQLAAGLIQLDGILAQYGPETRPLRETMRQGVGVMAEQIWRQNGPAAKRVAFEEDHTAEAFFAGLHALSAGTGVQRALKEQALQTAHELAKTRLLLFVNADTPIPMPFLIVLVLWRAILFASYSLFAKPNAAMVGALGVFALSTACAIFLILELGQPFSGLMQIPSDAVRTILPPLAPAAG
jgi:hypothetical protein